MTFLFAHKKKYIAAQWMLGVEWVVGTVARRSRDGAGGGEPWGLGGDPL